MDGRKNNKAQETSKINQKTIASSTKTTGAMVNFALSFREKRQQQTTRKRKTTKNRLGASVSKKVVLAGRDHRNR